MQRKTFRTPHILYYVPIPYLLTLYPLIMRVKVERAEFVWYYTLTVFHISYKNNYVKEFVNEEGALVHSQNRSIV